MVAQLCLMASATCHPCLFYQEPSLLKLPKSTKLEIPNYGWPISRLSLLGELWKPTYILPESNPSVRISSTSLMPSNVQDASIHFPFSPEIVEKCQRNEKVLQFLMSTSNKQGDIDSTVSLSNLMGLQNLDHGAPMLLELEGSFEDKIYVYDFSQFGVPYTMMDGKDASYHLSMSAYLNRKVLSINSEEDIQGLLSVLSEFYMPKYSVNYDRHTILVPYFDRFRFAKKRPKVSASPVNLQALADAPVQSPQKLHFTSSPKKKQRRKATSKRGLSQKNYFYACECLLGLLLDPHHDETLIMLSVKTSPELPKLLDQFSTGIAGTGLAVILFVMCKVAGGIVPFCATRLLHTGLGLGLIWLSLSVNGLRNVITDIIGNPSRTVYDENKMTKRMNRSLNEIFFRTLVLTAALVLTGPYFLSSPPSNLKPPGV